MRVQECAHDGCRYGGLLFHVTDCTGLVFTALVHDYILVTLLQLDQENLVVSV